jgi:hypothetical protein
MTSIFVIISRNFTDGEHEYADKVIAEIKNGLGLNEDEIYKTIFNQMFKNEFGDPEDADIDENYPNTVWDFDRERNISFERFAKIPASDYRVLAKYLIPNTLKAELDPEKVKFS